MDGSLATEHRPPASSPAPSYAHTGSPVHAISDYSPVTKTNTNDNFPPRSASKPRIQPPIARKPVPAALNLEVAAVVHNSPVSPVKIDGGIELPQASSALIENFNDDHDSPPPTAGFSRMTIQDPEQAYSGQDGSVAHFPPRRDSMLPARPPPVRQYEHTPASSDSWSVVEPQTRDDGSADPKKSCSSFEREAASGSHNSSSRGSLDSTAHTSEGYEPLHYHHQAARGSKTGLRSVSNPTENGPGNNAHLTARRANIPRPSSAYSSVSDLSGHARHSPRLMPHPHGHPPSRNSNPSPDGRPVSFVDLLNSAYPQPSPAPTQPLNHQFLRSAVGNNASLLSHKQTFDMYLANVKKTDDPAVQYEFAVFMLNAMQDLPREDADEGSANTAAHSGKDTAITRRGLLKEAKSILQRLADKSYPFAQYYLADGYASGLFSKGKEDYDRAFPLFVAASKHGHVEACYRTALCYEFGWGCRVDAAKAVQFYRQAASKNHPGAMLRMAKACLAGDMGLGKRYREGIKWLKRAAESSDEQYNSAPYELGLLHETGYGDDIFEDPAYAAQLFTKSADLGHVEANYRLGDAYEHGKLGCPRDPALSIHFYTGAAQRGHPLAMMALCAWYLVGAEPVLEKDEGEAYEWARRAAELGLAKAQYALGYFTEMGIGCRRDPLEANVWYVKAADQGDERAKHRIAAIRAAADGANPKLAAAGAAGAAAGSTRGKKHKGKPEEIDGGDKTGKSKRFGLF